MKFFLITVISLLSVTLKDGCRKSSAPPADCFKGRLEVKGLCMNYTIKVLEGKLDTSRMMSTWKDEATGKVHENVFRLASVCDFPKDIQQGDEFYFRIESSPRTQGCAVCMAYYPTPGKELSIVVQKNGCQ